MKIELTYVNSKGETYEWAVDHEKPLEQTIALLKQHYDAKRIAIIVKP
jgi:hypothetical protein